MTIRDILRALRYGPDRLLYPLHRRLALRRLRCLGMPRHVLFLCHGNICRSPYAARVFDAALPTAVRDALRVSSAGFFGPGRPSPEDAVRVAARHAVELQDHVSRRVTPELLREADLVVVMDGIQRKLVRQTAQRSTVLLGDVDPEPIEKRAIRDPIDQEAEVFESVYTRIDRCVGAMVNALNEL